LIEIVYTLFAVVSFFLPTLAHYRPFERLWRTDWVCLDIHCSVPGWERCWRWRRRRSGYPRRSRFGFGRDWIPASGWDSLRIWKKWNFL